MKFKKNGDIYFLRLEKGEEIVSSIKLFCENNKIKSGIIQGLGAISELGLGYFNPDTKEYSEKTFEGYREITSLIGNISKKGDDVYLHIHLSASGSSYSVIGGHLTKAVISATAEIVIIQSKCDIGRNFDKDIGLYLLEF